MHGGGLPRTRPAGRWKIATRGRGGKRVGLCPIGASLSVERRTPNIERRTWGPSCSTALSGVPRTSTANAGSRSSTSHLGPVALRGIFHSMLSVRCSVFDVPVLQQDTAELSAYGVPPPSRRVLGHLLRPHPSPSGSRRPSRSGPWRRGMAGRRASESHIRAAGQEIGSWPEASCRSGPAARRAGRGVDTRGTPCWAASRASPLASPRPRLRRDGPVRARLASGSLRTRG